ncbi:MAG: hypothetical protein ACREPB_10950 [Arenimonas sp.]
MDEKLVAAMVIITSALPALGIGLACITRRWMPGQYLKLPKSTQLQFILGLGMLGISTSLIAFGTLLPLLPEQTLSWMTTAFVIAINIEAFAMVFLLHRASKKTS